MVNPSRWSPGFPTLPAFLAEHLAADVPVALAERRGEGDRRLSAREVWDRSAAVAHALRAAGIVPGERVALLANNSVDWLIADFGILLAGAVVVPLFATTADDQIDYIFRDAEVRFAFVETAALARVRTAAPGVRIVALGDADGNAESLDRFVAGGMHAHRADERAVHAFTDGVDAEALAVLIYTSGTTGTPKGVMLCHRNLTSNALDAYDPQESHYEPGMVMLTVLPLAHIYAHTNALGYLLNRVQHWITTPERLLADLPVLRPHCVAFVPRIFERMLAAIVGRAAAAGGLQARLVPWALAVGKDAERRRRDRQHVPPLLALQDRLAHRLVLRKIKPRLGLDRLLYFVSGSAPLHRDTALAFAAMGLEIVEGYGQTETSPVATVNRPADNAIGTVGTPIRNVQVRIAADGEIEVHGPDVMLGYYHVAPAEQPFTADGWLQTGDIGHIDAAGRLTITDRKRELFKTTSGKWVSPSRIETAIKRSVYVGQVLAFGDNRPHPAALVAPNWDLVRQELGIPANVSTAEMALRDDVHRLMIREVEVNTADLAGFEQVHRVAVLPRDLTIEDGELSPTLKPRRRIVEARYTELIEAAYAEDLHKRAAASAS